jgi:hypothetical protein
MVAMEFPAERTLDGHLFYVIPEIRIAASDRLGLIITRLDSKETSGSVGQYTLVLRPSVDPYPLSQEAGNSLLPLFHGLERG